MTKKIFLTLTILLITSAFAADDVILKNLENAPSPKQEEMVEEKTQESHIASIYDIINNKIHWDTEVSKESLQKLFDEQFHESKDKARGGTRYSTTFEMRRLTYATPTDKIKLNEFNKFKFETGSRDYGHNNLIIPIKGIRESGEILTFRIIVQDVEKSSSESTLSTSPKSLPSIPAMPQAQPQQQAPIPSPRRAPPPVPATSSKLQHNPKIKEIELSTSPTRERGESLADKFKKMVVGTPAKKITDTSSGKSPNNMKLSRGSSSSKGSSEDIIQPSSSHPTQKGSSISSQVSGSPSKKSGSQIGSDNLINELKKVQEEKNLINN